MKKLHRWIVWLLLVVGVARGAPSFEESMTHAAAEYRQRATQAAAALNQTRLRIADEKAPLLKRLRAAEARIISAESESTRMETQREEATEQRRKSLKELETSRQTTSYARTLAQEGLKAVVDGLAPGEDQSLRDRLQELDAQFNGNSPATSGTTSMDVAEFLLDHIQQSLGGYRASGRALIAETSQVVPGTFAFVGPDAYFLPAAGGLAGTLRPKTGAKQPVSYALPNWNTAEAKSFFSGEPGTILADASGGKALRLAQTSGTVWQHVKKGGVVAFAILGVGVLAVLMVLQKVRDLARMGVDSPDAIGLVLDALAAGDRAAAEEAVAALKHGTRELFAEGLRHTDQPKVVLEERLQAVLLEQRMEAERRLPLLAVIATAAPLMGLLGTVVGMVKTFALITVFGTGNAGKLSSGISEVLVATELGLVVAIPTLVAHGFFAQRIQRNLALLERFALKFVTAVDTARFRAPEPRDETVSA